MADYPFGKDGPCEICGLDSCNCPSCGCINCARVELVVIMDGDAVDLRATRMATATEAARRRLLWELRVFGQ